MDDAFVPLARFFSRGEPPQAEPPCEPQPQPVTVPAEVRRFRAALADALDASRADLLRDLASAVLARELALAPCDIERIARRLLQEHTSQEPLAILVHESDAAVLPDLGIPLRTAAGLRRGDCTLVLRYGSIDASLGARLADLL